MKKKKLGSTGFQERNNWFDYLNCTLLGFFSLIALYPMIFVIAGSFNEGLDYIEGGIYLFPRKFSIENYLVVIQDLRLWNGYLVTIGRTVIGTITALLFTSMVAYAMSRKELKFRNAFYNLFIFTMFFGGGLIPYFLVINSIGLYDTFWVYIIPGLFSVYNMLVIVNFFKSIPEEIRESAIIDGASETRIFLQIYLPLSKPVLSTVGLWIAVGHWNSFFDSMIFTVNEKLQTLQYYLMKVVKESSPVTDGVSLPLEIINRLSPETVTLAAIMISVVPILILYPLIFKFLTKGIVIGSLKG